MCDVIQKVLLPSNFNNVSTFQCGVKYYNIHCPHSHFQNQLKFYDLRNKILSFARRKGVPFFAHENYTRH